MKNSPPEHSPCLDCRSFVFSRHAVLQMFARDIDPEEVTTVCTKGTIIESYEDDKPFSSFLVLGEVGHKYLHVVVAQDLQIRECVIVTTYEPDPTLWDKGFKTRKRS